MLSLASNPGRLMITDQKLYSQQVLTLALVLVSSCLLLMPASNAASSDQFPWSSPANSTESASAHLDQNGALTDVPNSSSIKSSPPGNLSAVGNATLSSDVAQGNIGATQSGPGASGLFTPASPGNNAALNAQMNGGLEGSPIVNGTGTNLRITVPLATPSQNPSYEQYTNDGVTGVLPVSPGLNSKALQSAQREVSQNKQSTPAKFTDLQTRPVSIREISNQRITPSYSTHKVQTRNQTPNNLGKVDGFIQYADGKSVMFGSNGALQIDKENNGVLKLNDGRTTKVSKIKSKSYLSKRKTI